MMRIDAVSASRLSEHQCRYHHFLNCLSKAHPSNHSDNFKHFCLISTFGSILFYSNLISVTTI